MEKQRHTRHVGISLLAMTALGVFAFWALQALAGTRIAHPAATGAGPEPADQTGIGALRAGVHAALASAARAVQEGRRAEAVATIDAARRAARVGRDTGAAGFATALAATEQARHAIQNGRFDASAPLLLQGAAALTAAVDEPPSPTDAAVPPERLADYRGATVLNEMGVRIGELESVDAETAAIYDARQRDAFGFIDHGGEHVEVPVSRLVFGRARHAGDTLVVLPTPATRLADVSPRLAPTAAE